MNPSRAFVCRAFLCILVSSIFACSQEKPLQGTWRFAVSGDSRNCGDVVMPAIAASVLRHDVEFYWHLGDFRLMSDVDEDMKVRYGDGLTPDEYHRVAWGDFIAHQMAPFGLLPVYLGIGNHELHSKTREDYAAQFAYWLDAPELRRQRAADKPAGSFTYYHWQHGHVDFITLDNGDEEGFSESQLLWLEGVLASDKAEPGIRSIVVGMHRALPNSLACGHSMNGDLRTPAEIAMKSLSSGRRAYKDLWTWHQETGKPVYVLASHSHFYMERIFETPYWQNTGTKDRGVLPGWIVGTAGAKRYSLPDGLPKDIRADAYVSGYMLGTVSEDGTIRFEFREVTQDDLPSLTYREFDPNFVLGCFLENKSPGAHPAPPSCEEK